MRGEIETPGSTENVPSLSLSLVYAPMYVSKRPIAGGTRRVYTRVRTLMGGRACTITVYSKDVIGRGRDSNDARSSRQSEVSFVCSNTPSHKAKRGKRERLEKEREGRKRTDDWRVCVFWRKEGMLQKNKNKNKSQLNCGKW